MMKHRSIKSALIAAALLLSANFSLAVESKPGTAAETKANSGPKATGKSARAAKAAASVKHVDINSASKKELKALPGISDADADKIIAGRPYLSKAHLATQNIISRPVYENLKALVIAKQKPEYLPNPKKK